MLQLTQEVEVELYVPRGQIQMLELETTKELKQLVQVLASEQARQLFKLLLQMVQTATFGKVPVGQDATHVRDVGSHI
jgi:hypothetical protein